MALSNRTSHPLSICWTSLCAAIYISIFPATPIYMTLNDLEWPFYVNFSLLRTDFESYYLLIYCRVSLHTHVTSGNVRSGIVDRDPQNICNVQKNSRVPDESFLCRSVFLHSYDLIQPSKMTSTEWLLQCFFLAPLPFPGPWLFWQDRYVGW